jgi:hypothetical protein
MRLQLTILAFGAVLSAHPAMAEGAVIVIPSRPGVPIMINGIDASYAVVEGDWGLARSVHVQPTIYGGRLIDPDPRVGGYFPSAGHAPGYGRAEIEPPQRRRRNTSYSRSWGAQSAAPAPPSPSGPPMMIDAQGGMPPGPYRQPEPGSRPRLAR